MHLPERVVVLACKPTVVYTGSPPYPLYATAEFTQLAAFPEMSSVVDTADNQLIVNSLPGNAAFSDDVLFTIILDTSGLLDSGGNAITGRWAFPTEGGPYPTTNGGKKQPFAPAGFCYFCPVDDYGPGSQINQITLEPLMVTSRQGGTQITISDQTPDGSGPYAFVLGIVLDDANQSYVRIDPVISSKGTSTAPT